MQKDQELWRAVEDLRSHSLGRLLLLASRRYSEKAMSLVREQGHPELSVAHAAILPHIDIKGLRLTELAERAGMTKQSASELVAALQGLGYLDRESDPSDRRAQRVVFTEKGREFLIAAYHAKLFLEEELKVKIGRSAAKAVLSGLRRYVAQDGDHKAGDFALSGGRGPGKHGLGKI